MAQYTKQTVVTSGNTTRSGKREASSSQTISYVMYFLFGLLEVLLAFRLVFKLAGANPSSSFVNMIYGITGIFILPFEGIFRRWFNQGVETTSVLEPSTLVAIVVYALLAWGIVKLIGVLSGEEQTD